MNLTAKAAGGIALAAIAWALGSHTSARAQEVAPYAPGSCLDFDGAHDYVRVPRSASLEPDEITIELWARLDGPQTTFARVLRKTAHNGAGYLLAADQFNDQRMQLRIDGPIRAEAKDPAPNTDYVGEWHHFAGVFSLDAAEFWVDGRLVRRVAHAIGPMTNSTLTDLFIGCGLPSPGPEFFHGRIDEVRIWNYPRSHAEISDHFHERMVGDEPGLIGYWNFDEGSGQVAHDSSPLHNDGELGSSPAPDEADPRWQPSRALVEPLP